MLHRAVTTRPDLCPLCLSFALSLTAVTLSHQHGSHLSGQLQGLRLLIRSSTSSLSSSSSPPCSITPTLSPSPSAASPPFSSSPCLFSPTLSPLPSSHSSSSPPFSLSSSPISPAVSFFLLLPPCLPFSNLTLHFHPSRPPSHSYLYLFFTASLLHHTQSLSSSSPWRSVIWRIA